jgi:hypothetical protein
MIAKLVAAHFFAFSVRTASLEQVRQPIFRGDLTSGGTTKLGSARLRVSWEFCLVETQCRQIQIPERRIPGSAARL